MIREVCGSGEGSSSELAKKGSKLPWFQASNAWSKDEFEFFDEEEEFGEKTECRICHDLEFISKLEAPCACKGTIKFAHRQCVQMWCNAKGNTVCEICRQRFQPGYPVPLNISEPRQVVNALQAYLSEGLTVPGIPRERQSADLTSEEVERLLEAQFDECNNEIHDNESGATACRKPILLFITILILKHITFFTDFPHDNDESSGWFDILLAALVFCYITSLAVNYWNSRRRTNATGELNRADVSILINSGENSRNILGSM